MYIYIYVTSQVTYVYVISRLDHGNPKCLGPIDPWGPMEAEALLFGRCGSAHNNARGCGGRQLPHYCAVTKVPYVSFMTAVAAAAAGA